MIATHREQPTRPRRGLPTNCEYSQRHKLRKRNKLLGGAKRGLSAPSWSLRQRSLRRLCSSFDHRLHLPFPHAATCSLKLAAEPSPACDRIRWQPRSCASATTNRLVKLGLPAAAAMPIFSEIKNRKKTLGYQGMPLLDGGHGGTMTAAFQIGKLGRRE